MKIFNSVSELIGSTPLVKLNKIKEKNSLKANLFAKVEYFNPTGSIKDRAAFFMLETAIKNGLVNNNTTIIEPTSGNTGIGLAALCASKGIKLILTMPNTMSKERIAFLKIYGAEIVLTDGKEGMQGSVEKAEELAKKIPNSFIPSQFSNPTNSESHFKTTGPEIWKDIDGKVDVVVACVGTGGTLTGIGKFLKEQNDNIEVVAVEPLNSPLLSKGYAGAHKIQGIGANFVPSILDKTVIDKILCVSDENAYFYAKELAKTEGYFVGISSGAALCAGVELAKRKEYEGKNIVTILPDSGDRYLSNFIE